jgi:RimJ/RimL family protein N-acetyltransferase
MTPPAADFEEVGLRDGARVAIRPIDRADKALVAAAFAALSPDSRYRRFFTPLETLDEQWLRYLTEVDHHDHEALLAIEPETGTCVGVARFIRVETEVAEPAVAVADRWQRRGLGTALLERLADRARAEGIGRFSGTMLAENHKAIRLVEQLGAGAALERDRTEVRFEIELPERDGLGSALGELLRAVAAGLLAPARALAPRSQARDE